LPLKKEIETEEKYTYAADSGERVQQAEGMMLLSVIEMGNLGTISKFSRRNF
jgi:hypothetical protein